MTGTPRFCRPDNYDTAYGDNQPRAIRWATRQNIHSPDWGRWHYTDGNRSFTSCGQPVRIIETDGSPEEGELRKITCRRCLAKMKHFGVESV